MNHTSVVDHSLPQKAFCLKSQYSHNLSAWSYKLIVNRIVLNQDHGFQLIPLGGGAVQINKTGDLTVKDLHTGVVYAGVTEWHFQSDPTPYNPAYGDWRFFWIDEGAGILGVTLNGHTGIEDPAYDCIDFKMYRKDLDFRNGLLKEVSTLYTNE